MDKKKKTTEWRRHRIQALWALLTNSYLAGFVQGKIYRGPLKKLCVPGLNCYSCPGALGSCPIGAMQAVIGSWNFKFAFYVAGFLMFIGALTGRFVCGWLCPFGLIQDLLHKIPFPKKIGTFKGDRLLRKLKYVILVLFVVLLPLCLTDVLGQGVPYFCKLICPAGTLEGGIPLAFMNSSMHSALGWLYVWKNVLLVIVVAAAVIIYRPFCKYICPITLFLKPMSYFSLFRIKVDEKKCISCGKCEKLCPMDVEVTSSSRKRKHGTECILCMKCVEECPKNALKL